MPETKLIINVGGSSFRADFDDLNPWRALLDGAEEIAIAQNNDKRVVVQLSGLRRWIAFSNTTNGSPLYCIGWQETVGAIQRGDWYIGGSNRKTLAWLHPSGKVEIGG